MKPIEYFKPGDIIVSKSGLFVYELKKLEYGIHKRKRVISYAILITESGKEITCTSGNVCDNPAKFNLKTTS